MVGVLTGGFDVDRKPSGLREATKEMAGHPRIGVERDLRERPAAEIDGHTRERVVHRYVGAAVARDPLTVSERTVESLTEGECGVLDGVVISGLQVADPVHDQVEPRMERELLEGSDRRYPTRCER